MLRRGLLAKPIGVLFLGGLLACSGGGSTGTHLPPPADPGTTATTHSITTLATTIQTCTLTSPCISGTNTSSGAGVGGISTNGRGVSGTTNHNSTASTNAMFGIYGKDNSTSGVWDGGVFGTSVRGYGVYGQSSSNIAVNGQSSSSIAVRGVSSSYIGVSGASTSYYGLYGSSSSSYGSVSTSGTGIGAYASGGADGLYAFSNANAVYGTSSTGTGVYANSGSGYALQAHTGGSVGAYITNSNGNGADVTGSYIGLVARSNSFPLVATNASGANLFYVDGAGNLYYHGGLHTFVSVGGGASATAFGTAATRPSIEDTGTATLVSGHATVNLDPALARAIDSRRPYQVFLTPGGDTRGLYVAQKGPSSFIVREVQGGRGTFSFDYHIYATALGEAGQHMTITQPRAPLLRRVTPASVRRPAIPETGSVLPSE
jgi:hypothetical protein